MIEDKAKMSELRDGGRYEISTSILTELAKTKTKETEY